MLLTLGTLMTALGGPPSTDDVGAVLDALHAAADAADADAYFGLFHPDAVFIGTDPTEVWALPAFRAWAEPRFAEAPAWSYTPVQRQVHEGPRGRTAWFYEVLRHARYGEVRGSGVLLKQRDGWRIQQYVLSFAVPNEAATLPTPFTAAQIRGAYVPGLVVVMRQVTDGAERFTRSEVVSADADGVRMVFTPVDAQGVPTGEPTDYAAAWTELRDHAAFPVGRARWSEVVHDGPLGSFPVRRYDVGEGDAVRSYWFSPAHPGPPLRMVGPGIELEVVSRQTP